MLRFLMMFVCCSALLTPAFSRGKPKPTIEKDSFDVVGHLPLSGGVYDRLVAAKHFSSSYLYAESSSANTVSVIDVTDTAHPRVLSSANGAGSVLAAVGDVALVSSTASAPAPAKTISILDFSDKANPKVAREFKGVTSVGSDDQRGLVFLVNADGLWILHRNQAIDPAVQEQYAHDVLYSH